MKDLIDRLDALDAMVAEVVAEVFTDGTLRVADEAEVLHLLTTTARVGRRLDGVLIEAVGEVEARSSSGDRDDRMTTRFGCHDVSELLERATLCSRATVARWRRAASAVPRDASITTGGDGRPGAPGIREAMYDGSSVSTGSSRSSARC